MTATDVRPAAGTSEPTVDERLAHRGPIQRLLLRPEIGALIGTTAIWAFFWAVAGVFGTAAGTASYLDVAATLGIMAVAVSLLMIGGEFDLSAGSMTGATAMLVILLSKDVGELGGAGLSLFLAVPLSLCFALTIGWFNGTIVDKTRLPSFIVTLGTFFMLIGAKLGFSKLFAGQVVVEGLDEADGYGFWRNVFAASWVRNEHVWEDRDIVWTVLLIVGVTLVVIGLLESTYRRAPTLDVTALVVGGVGAALALVGFLALLNTDGVGANTAFGVLTGVGVMMASLGYGRWRFTRLGKRGHVQLDRTSARLVVAALAAIAVGVLIAASLDPSSNDNVGLLVTIEFSRLMFVSGFGVAGILAVFVVAGRLPVWSPLLGLVICAVPAVGYLMTRQAARSVMFVVLALGGLVTLLVASARAAAWSASAGLAVELLTAAVLVGLGFFIRAESESEKFRSQLLTVILLIALALACSALMGYLYTVRTAPDEAADTFGRRAAIAGVLVVVVATAIKMLYTTAAENAVASGVIRYRISILWFAIFAIFGTWLLLRARFGNWIFAVGGNKEAARVEGIPAARTKTTLFMTVSGAAWLTGMLIAFRLNSVQANVGDGEEFEYIIAAVVGGNLLTGGYGSAAGGAIGSLIMSMSTQGIPFAGWNTNWRFLFLGVILLSAVAGNTYVRNKAASSK